MELSRGGTITNETSITDHLRVIGTKIDLVQEKSILTCIHVPLDERFIMFGIEISLVSLQATNRLRSYWNL